MSLSKRHIDTHNKEVSFDVDAFALALERALPEVEFALLMGSAQHGVVKAHSDLGLAFYLKKRANLEFYTKVCQGFGVRFAGTLILQHGGGKAARRLIGCASASGDDSPYLHGSALIPIAIPIAIATGTTALMHYRTNAGWNGKRLRDGLGRLWGKWRRCKII